MPIEQIVAGNITDPNNRRHMIIGMNDTLEDVTGIGKPFVHQLDHPLELGDVLTFQFNKNSQRLLHMLICHKIGHGGWKDAANWVSIGLGHLWKCRRNEHHVLYNADFSIVQIGNGKVGNQYGANVGTIISAISGSPLPVTMYVRNQAVAIPVVKKSEPLHALHVWNERRGEHLLTSHAA